MKFLTLLFIFLAQSVHATTIVFYVETNRIIAAADSLARPAAEGQKSFLHNKIAVGPNADVILAATGMIASLDGHFDALAIMLGAFATNHIENYCSNALNRIEWACSNYLFACFNGPDSEKFFKAQLDYALQLAVAHFHGGRPECSVRTFVARRDGQRFQIAIERRYTRFDPSEYDRQNFAMGEIAEIRPLLTSADYWNNGTPLERTARLVAAEISAEPEYVGWPIRIVDFTNEGLRWRYISNYTDIDGLRSANSASTVTTNSPLSRGK